MVTLDELKKTFAGKHVFVSGHTGFKGSWLIQILYEAGAVIKGYALEPETSHDLYISIEGDRLCDSVIGDIRDLKKLHHEITAFRPDFIFHLAAQPLVRRSYEQPLYTWEVNVNGTAHILEVARSLDYPCSVICITTDKVYENPEKGLPFRENDPLGGHDPYSASKAAAEIIIASYRSSFFGEDSPVCIASARAGNVIGGGDWARDRIIPDFVRARLAGKILPVRRPEAIRPWQHVLEPLAGYLRLAMELYREGNRFASAYNFGPETGDVLTVKELIEESARIWNGPAADFASTAEGPHEAGLLLLDISKARTELGFIPVWNARDAIRETIGWYMNNDESDRDKCRRQIRAYFGGAGA